MNEWALFWGGWIVLIIGLIMWFNLSFLAASLVLWVMSVSVRVEKDLKHRKSNIKVSKKGEGQ